MGCHIQCDQIGRLLLTNYLADVAHIFGEFWAILKIFLSIKKTAEDTLLTDFKNLLSDVGKKSDNFLLPDLVTLVKVCITN